MVKKLFIRGFILLLPFFIVGGYFVVADPMKLVYMGDSPLTPGVLMNDRLFQAKWLKKHDYEYNSFIFGSSRSKAFKASIWKNYLPDRSEVFHMGVNDETLLGVAKKMAFLDAQGYKIDNVLLSVDHRLLSLTKNHEEHVFREYYELTGETAGSFYQRFAIAFLDVDFLSSYFKWKRTGKVFEEDKTRLWDPGFTYDKRTGDHYYSRMDSLIAYDSVNYYQKKKEEVFYERQPVAKDSLLNEDARKLLVEIKDVLQKHQTNFKVVITPNYDQISMSDKDMNFLKELFGEERIFDFSGVNEFTKDYHDYYEHKHFKPYIASKLMKEVYGE